MSTPIRTYITENKEKFKNVAFFCTMGGSGDVRAFLEMKQMIGKEAISTLALKTAEAMKDDFSQKLEDFVKAVIN